MKNISEMTEQEIIALSDEEPNGEDNFNFD